MRSPKLHYLMPFKRWGSCQGDRLLDIKSYEQKTCGLKEMLKRLYFHGLGIIDGLWDVHIPIFFFCWWFFLVSILIAAVNEEIFATIFRMKNVLLYYSIPEVAATIWKSRKMISWTKEDLLFMINKKTWALYMWDRIYIHLIAALSLAYLCLTLLY